MGNVYRLTRCDSLCCLLYLLFGMECTILTLKWSRPSALPLVVKGGSLWTLTQKSTFPNEFGGEMRATDKVIQKNQNTAKKLKIGYSMTKWRPKNQFLLRDIKFPTKNGKTTFPKEIFLEIWLIIGDCKYNYTAEIKFVFYGENKF